MRVLNFGAIIAFLIASTPMVVDHGGGPRKFVLVPMCTRFPSTLMTTTVGHQVRLPLVIVMWTRKSALSTDLRMLVADSPRRFRDHRDGSFLRPEATALVLWYCVAQTPYPVGDADDAET